MSDGRSPSPMALPGGLSRSEAVHTLVASFLGWTLDAFDFFVLVFVLPAIAAEFHRSIADLAFTITATLAMRPIGALAFGWLADRYGRRGPLMADIILFSVIEFASGLAPSYRWFLLLRAHLRNRDGRRMGRRRLDRDGSGSVAMARVALRGCCKRAMRSAICSRRRASFLIFPHFGWRPLFFIGGAPALLTLYIRSKVPESKAWERMRPAAGAICERDSPQPRTVRLPRCADDDDEPGFAWHAGHVSDFSREGTRARAAHGRHGRDHLQCRRAAGRPDLRLALGPLGQASRDGHGGPARCHGRPAVDLCAFARLADRRRLPDAVHRAGRVGRDPRPSG